MFLEEFRKFKTESGQSEFSGDRSVVSSTEDDGITSVSSAPTDVLGDITGFEVET